MRKRGGATTHRLFFVMPGLVPGIQPTACSGARFALGPGNKCRDDMEVELEFSSKTLRV
jgi:hypothetical protein